MVKHIPFSNEGDSQQKYACKGISIHCESGAAKKTSFAMLHTLLFSTDVCNEVYLSCVLPNVRTIKTDTLSAAPDHPRHLTTVKKHSHFRPVWRPYNYVTGNVLSESCYYS
jgi:hypothetical protein